MKKSILEIYALSICFSAVICFMFSCGFAAYALVRMSKPDFTMDGWQYRKYQSNDAFWSAHAGKSKQPRPGAAKLSQRRQQAFSAALREEQRDGAQTLVKSLIVVLIDMAVFSVHWMIARKSVGMEKDDEMPF